MKSGIQVRAWTEIVAIPTYACASPTPHPLFLDKRVYQGSSGKVYPYAVVESVSDAKQDRQYQAAFLENEFLKIMILPELGGRVQMALDKTNDYHVVYYNRVIKPALVGLAGPWISGGIEFNWPQHHRPSTFLPVDWDIIDNGDGAQTVWCHEIDRMEGTEASHGFTLYPGKAYLEVRVRLFNRTSLPQTFLWWANPAVHADENHQSIFPPDVHAVLDHGKRAVSSFPIATGEYYKVDYSPGTDISRYKNIPVPTSYMAYHSDYDFVGSYDHERQAGLLHVANHHVVPGKKQWTWGCGDFGRRWDRHLTDADGPYVELMCGAYTDNQPDFSWLMPGEEKAFSQFFLPYKGVGVVTNATVDAAVGLEVDGELAKVRVYTTAEFPAARIVLRVGDQVPIDERFDASPREAFEFVGRLGPNAEAAELTVQVFNGAGVELVRYEARHAVHEEIPEPARAIGAPGSLDSAEALYLAGLHLEQYRHATRDPESYYRDALRRSPSDLRCRNALGRLLYRRGLFAEAEKHFLAAVNTSIRHNGNPYDGEPFFNLGLALAAQRHFDAAYDAFYKAAWNAAWRDAACFELARIALRRGKLAEACELLGNCLDRNPRYHQAVHFRVFALQQLGRTEEAKRIAENEIHRDPFNFGVLFEQAAALGGDWTAFDKRLQGSSHNYLALAADYDAAGLTDRAIAVLVRYLDRVDGRADTALVHYTLAELYDRAGDEARSQDQARRGANTIREGFFPNGLPALRTLEAAVARNPTDSRAWNDLGNLRYSVKRHDDAIAAWQRAEELDAMFPHPRRNLGVAYFNQRKDATAAWRWLASAFEIDSSDARVLFELDQLAKRLNHDAEERVCRLEAHFDCVCQRDDLSLEYVTLLNQLGRHKQALAALLSRNFRPWEGGEGKISSQYTLALTELARTAIAAGRYEDAAAYLQQAQLWPESLGEGKLAGIQENNIHYWLGEAYRGLHDEPLAEQCFERAATGIAEPSSPQFYNDQPPDMIYYQGLALRALEREAEAADRFQLLADYGESHLNDEVEVDFFAVSLPEFLVFDADLKARHEIHCRYMRALGQAGLGNLRDAEAQFDRVLALDRNHLGALVHRRFTEAMTGVAR
jgi:tetratricopeptide (TPR) repeat protein